MKLRIATLALIITTTSLMAQNGKASTEKKTFSRSTTITENINAPAEEIWKLLTDAAGYPLWNSTVISVEGDVRPGEKIKLKSTLDPSRTFKLKVKEFVPNERLMWGDAMGERTYLLATVGGSTQFTMTEKIGGFMFPLFASKIPSFDESFETFVSDLKKTAEAR